MPSELRNRWGQRGPGVDRGETRRIRRSPPPSRLNDLPGRAAQAVHVVEVVRFDGHGPVEHVGVDQPGGQTTRIRHALDRLRTTPPQGGEQVETRTPGVEPRGSDLFVTSVAHRWRTPHLCSVTCTPASLAANLFNRLVLVALSRRGVTHARDSYVDRAHVSWQWYRPRVGRRRFRQRRVRLTLVPFVAGGLDDSAPRDRRRRGRARHRHRAAQRALSRQ